MKTLFIAAILATLPMAANAADIPVTPAKPLVVDNWSGFYMGGNGGYGWIDTKVTPRPNDATLALATTPGINGGTPMMPFSFGYKGGLAGVQAGYNWRITRGTLLGFETDFQWSSIKGTGTSEPFLLGGFGDPSTIKASQDIKWFGTIRARLGVLITENWLIYATAGFFYARVDQTVVLNSGFSNNLVGPGTIGFQCLPGPNCFVGSTSRIATGWTPGVGMEFALTHNVSVKTDYLYMNLRGKQVNADAQLPAPGFALRSSLTANDDTNLHLIRAGINWRY